MIGRLLLLVTLLAPQDKPRPPEFKPAPPKIEPKPPIKIVPPIMLEAPNTNYVELKAMEGHNASVSCLRFRNDGVLVISGDNKGKILTWDVPLRDRFFLEFTHPVRVNSVDYSPDRKLIATATFASEALKVYSMPDKKAVAEFNEPHGIVDTVAFSPDGKLLAVAGKELFLFDVASRKLLRKFGDTFRCAAFTPDSKRIFAGHAKKIARAWDVESGKELFALEGHGDDIFSIAVSPDGKQVATGSLDKTIKIWSAADGKEIRALTGHENGGVHCVRYTPDGRALASGGNDGKIKFWDARSGKELNTLDCGKIAIHGLDFGPEGKLMATGGTDAKVRLWELKEKTSRAAPALEPHQAIVRVYVRRDNRAVPLEGLKATLDMTLDGGEKRTIPLDRVPAKGRVLSKSRTGEIRSVKGTDVELLVETALRESDVEHFQGRIPLEIKGRLVKFTAGVTIIGEDGLAVSGFQFPLEKPGHYLDGLLKLRGMAETLDGLLLDGKADEAKRMGAQIQEEIKTVKDLAAFDSLEKEIQERKECLNELSEMTSLRLQNQMERRSKFLETLSNIMKKHSDTQQSIIQNMK